jgi:hypothetical protein
LTPFYFFDGFTYALESIAGEGGIRRFVHVSNEPRHQLDTVSARLTIHTSNTVQPELQIPITLDSIGQISVDPARFFFGQVRRDSEAQKAIQLSSSENPFAILDISCDLAFVQIEQGSETMGENHTLTATVTTDAPLGRFKGTVKALTDNTYQPKIEIPILGTVTE